MGRAMWKVVKFGGHQPFALQRDDGLILKVLRAGKLVQRRWSSRAMAKKLAEAMNYVEAN